MNNEKKDATGRTASTSKKGKNKIVEVKDKIVQAVDLNGDGNIDI